MWSVLARIVTPVELTIKLLRDTEIQFADSPVSVLVLPGLFDFSRSLGVLYNLWIKFCADHSSRCQGEVIPDQIRRQENLHPASQWDSHKCQITTSISSSNEEDYLLINAPVIFVGNGRGEGMNKWEERAWKIMISTIHKHEKKFTIYSFQGGK